METRNDTPFKAVHPGSILGGELRERGIRQTDFAREIGMLPSNLSGLIAGRRNVTPAIAQRLEAALGIPATLWLSLQSAYALDNAEIRRRVAHDTVQVTARLSPAAYAVYQRQPNKSAFINALILGTAERHA